MGRQEWINNIIFLQARCRGYVIRKELKCVHAEYGEIVRELQGSLEHLSWRRRLIPRPHFTDTDHIVLRYPQPKIQTQEEPEGVKEVTAQDETPCDFLVPERDEKPLNHCAEAPGDHAECEVLRRGRVEETAALTLHTSDTLQRAPLMCVPKDVAHTPEALKQHRNTLAMELLWIQQAIGSRKKYLTLKQKMGAS